MKVDSHFFRINPYVSFLTLLDGSRIKLLATIFLFQFIFLAGLQAQFTKISGARGLANNSGGTDFNGHAWGDLNDDGYPDVIMHIGVSGSLTRGKLFINSGPPGWTFTDRTSSLINGFNDADNFGRQMLIVDFNNDGYYDILRGFGGNRYIEIYYNDGPPNFTFGTATQQPDVLIGAPAGGGEWNTEGVGAIDWNQDGWLDLVVDNDGGGNDIFQNDKAGGFIAISPGTGPGQTGFPASHAGDGDYCTVADVDNDGYVDFYGRKTAVSNYWRFDPTISQFVTQAVPNVVSSETDKGGTMYCDFDGDGDLDLFWTSHGQNQIWRFDGGGVWTPLGIPGNPLSTQTNIDGCDCGDVDNDGDMDIVMGASSGPSYLLRNVSSPGGPLAFTRVNITTNVNTESMTLTDFDNDGDLDLYTVVDGGANQLWENTTNNNNYFYVTALYDNGNGTSRLATGANVALTNCKGEITSMRQVSGGKGHGSQHQTKVHFGISDPEEVYYVIVYYVYKDGSRKVITRPIVPSKMPGNEIVIKDTDADGIMFCPFPPFAINDLNSTLIDQQTSGQVLTNDNEINGDLLTVNSNPISGTTNGTLILKPDGTYTYTPNPGFTGEDQFSYEVCDDQVPPLGPLCDTAFVFIEVISPGLGNDPPIASCDANQTLVNVPVTGVSLLSNDSDPDKDPLSINTTPHSTPSNGTVVINPDGTYTYTPVLDFTGEDSFTYSICDNGSPALCDTALVTIRVTPSDGSNVTFASDDATTTAINRPVLGELLTNDFDPEGDIQMVSVLPIGGPAHGSVSFDPTSQQYRYTPDPDYTGPDQFIYAVCDDGAPVACDTATVYITVFPDNNPPLGAMDINNTLINMATGGNVLTNDQDIDGDDLTVSVVLVSNPTNGTVFLDPKGEYTYIPNVDFIGSDKFSYAVCDDQVSPLGPLCDTVDVIINVRDIDGAVPPVANPDQFHTLANVRVTGSILVNDNDPNGDLLTINTSPISGPSNGVVVILPNGNFAFTPNTDFVGVDYFTYSICDDGTPVLCDTAIVRVDVLPDDVAVLNDPPFPTDDTYAGRESMPITGNILPNDFDPNGDMIVVNTSPIELPTHGSVILNPDGSFNYVPMPGYSGPDQFVYEICDDQVPALCAFATVYFTIYPENLFPVEWLRFDAVLEGKDALVRWATAIEVGADYYMVQRSYDGKIFGNKGRVEAAGNSQTVLSYQFIDKEVVGAGFANVYYRLKQVDIDGAFSFSDVVELQVPKASAMEAKVYPNPATDRAWVELRNHSGEYVSFKLFDAKGALVFSSGMEGNDHGIQRISVPMEGLSPGIYMYHISTDGHRLGGRIVKAP